MPTPAVGMIVAGVVALAAGLALAWGRVRAASGVGKVIALGPIFEAAPLAVFGVEHFYFARGMASMVPRWLPWSEFWVYFFGVALIAAAISLVLWRCVRWSAPLLALFFLIIVATLDLLNLPGHLHERLFWTLLVRETAFGCGALVLAGSVWPWGSNAGRLVARIARSGLAAILIFYAVEHFLFPRNVPGVPLEKMIPAWVPAPVALSYFVGAVLLVAGIGLLIPRMARTAAAGAGTVLMLLVALFYVPILVTEIHTDLAVEGVNYVFDTMLFAGTILLAGFTAEDAGVSG